MPHVTEPDGTKPTVNGDVSSSRSLNHLVSLPAISTAIDSLTTNPVGEKLVSIAKQGHESVVAPVFDSTPAQYVKPYAAHLDSMAEGGLSKAEETFPIITEDVNKITGTMKGMASDLVWFPFRRAVVVYNYMITTYSKEHHRCGGRGVIAGGTAILTSQLAVTGDGLAMFSSILTRNGRKAS